MAFWERVKEYFNLQPDKEDEQQTIAQISSSVAFRGANLWVLIFAILIASLGLNVNSTAVIIGAMLISPLMGPIIGMGLAVGINDLDLLRRSAKHFGVATLISVLTAMCYFLISPLGDAQSELLARTSPTLYDVLIAFCGGAAGIIALTTRGKGNVIPGVAIATALMPPLCTAGYGLATGHWLYFLGAFYLFFINTVFICLATFLGVRLLKFHQREFVSPARAHKARNIITAIVLATMIPAAIMTINIVEKSIFGRDIKHFVDNELTQDGTQILSSTPDRASHTLNIVAVGRFGRAHDAMVITTVMFALAAVLCTAVALVAEPVPDFATLTPRFWGCMAYVVLGSTVTALLLQNVGQRHVPPAQAALLLSLESVFAVLFSIVFYGEKVTPPLMTGFVLIFVAITVSQFGLGPLARAKARD